jgi:hypothetical protein
VPEAEDFHHSVYVILLDPAVIGKPEPDQQTLGL